MNFRSFFRIALSISLALLLRYAQCQQSAGPKLGHNAKKMRSKIAATAKGERLTVIVKDGSVYEGTLLAAENLHFSLNERNIAQVVDIQYEDVSKVKLGYPDHPSRLAQTPGRRALIGVIIIGSLLGLVFGLLATDRS